MRNRLISLFLLLSIVGVSTSGCAKLMGSLRKDLDDSEPYSPPTVGGIWSERGFLQQDAPEAYDSVGHAERGLASAGGYAAADARRSWVTPEDQDAARRNMARLNGEDEGEGGPSYANTPTLPPSVKRLYKNGNRATRADFVDESPNEGSLWASDGQTNYYFTKNKIRGIGDLLTVNVEADLVKNAVTEVTRTLTPREREMELALAQERIKARTLGLPEPGTSKDANKDQVATSAAAPARTPAAAGGANATAEKPEEKEVTVPKATPADVDVGKSLDFKAGDSIMAEIVERYPNGNYKIRGTKKVRYHNAYRMVTLLGVARGSDITEDDTIPSGKLYEYRLEVVR